MTIEELMQKINSHIAQEDRIQYTIVRAVFLNQNLTEDIFVDLSR